MKEKPSEWIAISDLMAGVMAVVMLMLVISVLQKGTSELAHKEKLAKAEEELKMVKQGGGNPVAIVLNNLEQMIQNHSSKEFISLDLQTKRLTLRDSVFERGSACLTGDAKSAVESVQIHFANFLAENPTARIMVEGHTDNVPVKSPVTDYRRFCTVYDDNFTLSAARAREARRYLIGQLNVDAARRVIVAGYGESRVLPDTSPSDSKNRRVEVLFVLE
jgi:chemotaxis protein MotB